MKRREFMALVGGVAAAGSPQMPAWRRQKRTSAIPKEQTSCGRAACQNRKPSLKQKAARRRLFNSTLMIVVQAAASNAGFDSRR